MIRARNLSNIHKKRTLRPVYATHQATPWAMFLDTAAVGTTTVVPGMVALRSTGETVKVHDGGTGAPLGLFANFINGDLDEIGDSTEVGVWRGGPDSQFEVLSDALDTSITWTSANSGDLIYSNANGKLTTDSNGNTRIPVARLVEAPSNSKIVISLELGMPPRSW